jgi:SpoVK/Ycf46/Vps4 family AAA+-type ATPase
LADRAAVHDELLDRYGFGTKLGQGRGIAALFAGPSGTGKSMAAEVLAVALGLDLYRVDLATVVDKYIGETEKNLDAVFRAAEDASAILLFDEADALFGKRSEVRDSHDRYANLEISYLLQRMEQFAGLAVLSTNMHANLDDAFTRRLAAVVWFPFPEAAQRTELWRRVWPAALPREPLDEDDLGARFPLSGGSIKAAALAAAAFAVGEGCPVGAVHVRRAVAREYQKVGRAMTADELGGPT